MSCARAPDRWRVAHGSSTAAVVVSASCAAVTAGEVRWTAPATVRTALRGPATITGPCPLAIALAGATIDATFNCTNGAPAVRVAGPGVAVSGTALAGPLVIASSATGVDVAGLVVAGVAAPGAPLAILGHTTGDVSITCRAPAHVVSQPVSGRISHSPACRAVNIAELLGVFGRRYELQYYHKNVFAVPATDTLSVLLSVVLVGAASVLIVHQDKWSQLFAKAPP